MLEAAANDSRLSVYDQFTLMQAAQQAANAADVEEGTRLSEDPDFRITDPVDAALAEAESALAALDEMAADTARRYVRSRHA